MDTDTLKINYEKRKNTTLFSQFQSEEMLNFSEIQNYIPIYNRFFSLTETNYNSINLNHSLYLKEIKNSVPDNKNLYNCNIYDIKTSTTSKKPVFFKLAPLLDPFKYLIGKYNIDDPQLFRLPKFASEIGSIHPKILDTNNSASIDGLVAYLSSLLISNNNFIHGVEYYGSFIGIKQSFEINIADDLDYLYKSDFFNKNKNVAFQVEDYDFMINKTDALVPIKIDHTASNKSMISIDSIDNSMFENIFDDKNYVSLDELKEYNIELMDIMNINTNTNTNADVNTNTIINVKSGTNSSGSTCSSRTSHTSNNSKMEVKRINIGDERDLGEEEEEEEEKEEEKEKEEEENECKDEDEENNWEDVSDSDCSQEEVIIATIPKFPVQVICMEYCEDTFDNLIMDNELSHDEWFSALMQIIMILITYQKAFSFTHNDLHTNNVMYNTTDLKFIYYCYKKKYYKVPTFGRIFKIIDFGRSIYKFNNKTFCSDSFQQGSDAATQYNAEPYFNDKKPRLEPNYSFDLCRLACSIFDYVIDELDEITNLEKCEPIVRLIYEWCLDDTGTNILYKTNGSERYPDFKLYKMIARCVHNHTPQAQLDRKEFSQYCVNSKNIKGKKIIDIDNL